MTGLPTLLMICCVFFASPRDGDAFALSTRSGRATAKGFLEICSIRRDNDQAAAARTATLSPSEQRSIDDEDEDDENGDGVEAARATTSFSTSLFGRRRFLAKTAASLSIVASTTTTTNDDDDDVWALDVDAFANSELRRDATRSEMSEDEALCRFGQPSREKGEACDRAGIVLAKKKNGLDAYGNVDRGSFARCKKKWDTGPDGKYAATTVCE